MNVLHKGFVGVGKQERMVCASSHLYYLVFSCQLYAFLVIFLSVSHLSMVILYLTFNPHFCPHCNIYEQIAVSLGALLFYHQ